MFTASFGVAQSKQNKKILLLLLKEVLGHGNHVLNQISSFKRKTLFKMFTFVLILFVLNNVIDL